MKSVTDGNGTTHFFDVFDGKTKLGSSMLFIPTAVSLVEQVPMLIYFHGHNSKNSIEDYIVTTFHHKHAGDTTPRDFRPLLRDKKVLLVEPWGGHRSRFGALGTVNGVGSLIDQAMFTAISIGPPMRACPVKTPSPPSLILAGFSGGGATLAAVGTSSRGAWHNLVSEIWCFDCMYSGEGSDWVNWARDPANKSRKLRVRLSDSEDTGSPRAEGDTMRAAIGKSMSNVDVPAVVSSGHEELPGKFIPTWL
jgi:hypothetical protein